MIFFSDLHNASAISDCPPKGNLYAKMSRRLPNQYRKSRNPLSDWRYLALNKVSETRFEQGSRTAGRRFTIQSDSSTIRLCSSTPQTGALFDLLVRLVSRWTAG